ncbi:MAG: SDR family oxidoreductase [Bacteroidia bacterium]
MDLNLTGKTALVGGSSQGIGRATAHVLASLGANIVLLARNETALNQTKDDLPKTGNQQHEILVADYAQPETVKQQIHAFVKQGKKIHILVNNTGGPAPGPASEALEEQFLNAFNQHLICNHILAQALLPGMRQEGYGRIINIISTSVKQPIPGLGVSNTIRAAVANWAKTLSLEVAKHGITVNNVLPGATYTGRLQSIIQNKSSKAEMPLDEIEQQMIHEIPVGRFALPEEIANAVAFLASPAAAYINGINLPVDGGRTACL